MEWGEGGLPWCLSRGSRVDRRGGLWSMRQGHRICQGRNWKREKNILPVLKSATEPEQGRRKWTELRELMRMTYLACVSKGESRGQWRLKHLEMLPRNTGTTEFPVPIGEGRRAVVQEVQGHTEVGSHSVNTCSKYTRTHTVHPDPGIPVECSWLGM